MLNERRMKTIFTTLALLLILTINLQGQENNSNFATQTVDRKVETLLLMERLDDIAYVDVVRLAGPAPVYQKETGTAFKDSLLGNQLKFYAYVFIPRETKRTRNIRCWCSRTAAYTATSPRDRCTSCEKCWRRAISSWHRITAAARGTGGAFMKTSTTEGWKTRM